ncbi:MAG TPA: PQQ-binding-like beta-propeller repeat protein [Gemmatimonadaceae bacterium]|nr:PQQ-binding-like beta-propeller repeat protein [Gemmatimonadaceae bacterium]
MSSCTRGHTGRQDADQEWPVTGGDPGNSRYSALAQIDTANVGRLRVAWVYHTGDALTQGNRTQIQATPVVVRGVLYATSASGKAFAIAADSGRELWRFDPFAGREPELSANRGVAYWEEGAERRVFFTAGSRLYALDVATGRPVQTFGGGGWVELREGLGREITGASAVVATTPGMVYRDLLIQGTRVSEGDGAAPGHVRAYDVRTGRIRWTFHTIPQPGEPGHETWPAEAWRTAGGANSWTGMAVDVRRGVVYVPTGSASPDFYGGDRPGQNLYANSLVALDAATGRRLWHFQTVHHDVWDRDLPAAPNLLTVERDGRRVDAVAQIAKSGFVFLFDRESGAPLFPIEERPVAASDIPGEQLWPTQPFPTKPAPFARQLLTEDSLTDRTPAAHAAALARYRSLRPGGLFTPPSLAGSIIFPGYDGGGEWGGAAVDRERGVMYVNASDVPWIAELVPTGATSTNQGRTRPGAEVYAAACASCHRPDRRGDGGRTPSLVGVGSRLSAAQVRDVIDHGRGFMPGFAAALPDAERAAVTVFLVGEPGGPASGRGPAERVRQDRGAPSPYRLKEYERWRDPRGYPAVQPPWGTLNAIDLNTGEYLWKITLGDFAEIPGPPTGTEQYGGPIVTAGGVLFIGATQDEKFRAFAARDGRLLWETTLPAAGYATPSTYSVRGRQFVVIAAGGGKLGTKSGDAYVAFALPD